jgi:hypothetical protein
MENPGRRDMNVFSKTDVLKVNNQCETIKRCSLKEVNKS